MNHNIALLFYLNLLHTNKYYYQDSVILLRQIIITFTEHHNALEEKLENNIIFKFLIKVKVDFNDTMKYLLSWST